MAHKLKTTVLIEIEGAQIERDCQIEYDRRKGCDATLEQPGEDDSIEVTGIEIVGNDGRYHDAYWLLGVLADDDDIQALLMADWADDAIAAAEYRAEQRADDRMMERFS